MEGRDEEERRAESMGGRRDLRTQRDLLEGIVRLLDPKTPQPLVQAADGPLLPVVPRELIPPAACVWRPQGN